MAIENKITNAAISDKQLNETLEQFEEGRSIDALVFITPNLRQKANVKKAVKGRDKIVQITWAEIRDILFELRMEQNLDFKTGLIIDDFLIYVHNNVVGE